MERNSLGSKLKHHSIGGRSINKDNHHTTTTNSSSSRLKDSWEYSSRGEDLLSGIISWPPRSYNCSFCKREFRSAQALGGHMNVHRRDRARLRQYSPPPTPRDAHGHGQYPLLNLNQNPSPNPNQNPNNPYSTSQASSPSTRFPPFTSALPPLICPSPSSQSSPISSVSPSEVKKWVVGTSGSDFTKVKSSKTLFGVGEFNGFTIESGVLLKKAEIVGLDLGIGLLSQSKEDLDLELRLGRS